MRSTREYHLEKFVGHVYDILGGVSIRGLRDNAEEWEEILRVQLFSKAYCLRWTLGGNTFDNILPRSKEMWLTLKEDDDRLEKLLQGEEDV